MTLTFLIGTGIRYGITSVVQGVRAAKDFNNPDGPQVRYNKKGRVKKNGAVYNLVTRGLEANQRRKGGEAGDNQEAAQEDDDSSSSHAGDLAPQSHQREGHATQSKPSDAGERPDLNRYNSQLPPPSYDEVTGSSRPSEAFGALPIAGPSHQQHYGPALSSTGYTQSYVAPAELGYQSYRQGSAHSSLSSSAASGREQEQFREASRESPLQPPPMASSAIPVGMSKSEYKKEQKDLKRQYEAMRDVRKAIRKVDQTHAPDPFLSPELSMAPQSKSEYERRQKDLKKQYEARRDEQRVMGRMTDLRIDDSPSSSGQPQSHSALPTKDDLKKREKELKKQYKSTRDEQKAMRNMDDRHFAEPRPSTYAAAAPSGPSWQQQSQSPVGAYQQQNVAAMSKGDYKAEKKQLKKQYEHMRDERKAMRK